jgi:hypothetical protein
LSRCAFVAFDFTSQLFTARALGALIRFHLVRQLACRVQMVRLVDAPMQSMDTPLRCPLLDVSSCSNFQIPPDLVVRSSVAERYNSVTWAVSV